MTVRFVYSTFPDKKAVEDLAYECIEESYAACVNYWQLGASIYEWKGKVHSEKEIAVVFKTSKKKLKTLLDFIEKNHPYDVPCIAVFEPEKINKAYLKWLTAKTK